METTLRIKNATLDDEAIDLLVRNLCETIKDETDMTASLVSGEGGAGEKGDPVTLGVIILSFISSGAAVALFSVLKSYFDRDSELELEIPQEDGKSIKFTAKNLSRSQFNRALGIVEDISEKD